MQNTVSGSTRIVEYRDEHFSVPLNIPNSHECRWKFCPGIGNNYYCQLPVLLPREVTYGDRKDPQLSICAGQFIGRGSSVYEKPF